LLNQISGMIEKLENYRINFFINKLNLQKN